VKMTIRIASGIAAVGLALGVWAGPSRVIHTPPASLTMGDAVPIEVRIEGVPDGEPLVVLHYRIAGGGEYASQRLESLGQARYAGAIPSGHARAIELMYYVDVSGPDKAYYTSLGAPEAPMRLVLQSPPGKGPKSWLEKAAVLLVGMGGIALLVWLRERRQRALTLDRVFWVRTLLPVVHLSGPALTEPLAKLSSRPLPHPTLGFRAFTRKHILSKINEIRRLDLSELASARDRYLGPGFELPSAETVERQRRIARHVVAFGKQTP